MKAENLPFQKSAWEKNSFLLLAPHLLLYSIIILIFTLSHRSHTAVLLFSFVPRFIIPFFFRNGKTCSNQTGIFCFFHKTETTSFLRFLPQFISLSLYALSRSIALIPLHNFTPLSFSPTTISCVSNSSGYTKIRDTLFPDRLPH